MSWLRVLKKMGTLIIWKSVQWPWSCNGSRNIGHEGLVEAGAQRGGSENP